MKPEYRDDRLVDIPRCWAIEPMPRLHRCTEPTAPGLVVCRKHIAQHEHFLKRAVDRVLRSLR